MDNEEAKARLKKTIRHLMKENIPFSLTDVTDYLIKNKQLVINKEDLVIKAILAIDDAKVSPSPKSEDTTYKAIFYVAKEVINESTS